MSEKAEFKPIKSLPKNDSGQLTYEPFTASGNKYLFIRPGSEIGIKKWGEYEKLKIVVGTGQTFQGIVQAFNEIGTVAAADNPFAEIRKEVILLADAYKKGILDMSRDRFNKAFYLCSLFIYREGDDPYQWSMERAEQYISDWEEERISELDLFFFAMLLIPGYNNVLQELKGEADKQAAKLSVVTG